MEPMDMADVLIDEGIGVDIALRLRAQGLGAFHALEFLPKGASDALVFQLAQSQALTIFTCNRDHFVLLTEAWQLWGHGSHHGVIARLIGKPQPSPADAQRAVDRYCRDGSSFVDRIELFLRAAHLRLMWWSIEVIEEDEQAREMRGIETDVG
jgi:hypothetical protein